jgi:2-C-methyl-D-erythritol 4-phosphate cytidylyltransferase
LSGSGDSSGTARPGADADLGIDLPPAGVILPAGGKGLRAGSPEPKQFLPLAGGKTMLAYAVDAFHELVCVKSIVLALPRERLAEFAPLAASHPKLRLVEGGSERWVSVRNAFQALDPRLPYVLVHDVARPFVSAEVIRRCLEAASPDACAIAALPSPDTIKEVERDRVQRTLDRGRMILVQTPQVFPRRVLEAVYARAWTGDIPTDEATLAERAGFPVRWVMGSGVNRKITGAADLEWARWLAARIAAGEAPPE